MGTYIGRGLDSNLWILDPTCILLFEQIKAITTFEKYQWIMIWDAAGRKKKAFEFYIYIYVYVVNDVFSGICLKETELIVCTLDNIQKIVIQTVHLILSRYILSLEAHTNTTRPRARQPETRRGASVIEGLWCHILQSPVVLVSREVNKNNLMGGQL